MIHKFRSSLVRGSLLALSLLSVVSGAGASVCQVTSATWYETISCGGGRGEAWGFVGGFNKRLAVMKNWGTTSDTANAVGRFHNGQVISECSATDSGPVDVYPAIDTTSCSICSKFTLTVQYN